MNEDKKKFLDALREFTNEVQTADMNPITGPVIIFYDDGKIEAKRFFGDPIPTTKDGGSGSGSGSVPP